MNNVGRFKYGLDSLTDWSIEFKDQLNRIELFNKLNVPDLIMGLSNESYIKNENSLFHIFSTQTQSVRK
jgi:hypothetical protein